MAQRGILSVDMSRDLRVFLLVGSAGFLLSANAAEPEQFPYGHPPEKRPNIPLSAAVDRLVRQRDGELHEACPESEAVPGSISPGARAMPSLWPEIRSLDC